MGHPQNKRFNGRENSGNLATQTTAVGPVQAGPIGEIPQENGNDRTPNVIEYYLEEIYIPGGGVG